MRNCVEVRIIIQEEQKSLKYTSGKTLGPLREQIEVAERSGNSELADALLRAHRDVSIAFRNHLPCEGKGG